jgi:hypothetical protein
MPIWKRRNQAPTSSAVHFGIGEVLTRVPIEPHRDPTWHHLDRPDADGLERRAGHIRHDAVCGNAGRGVAHRIATPGRQVIDRDHRLAELGVHHHHIEGSERVERWCGPVVAGDRPVGRTDGNGPRLDGCSGRPSAPCAGIAVGQAGGRVGGRGGGRGGGRRGRTAGTLRGRLAGRPGADGGPARGGIAQSWDNGAR